MVISSEIKVHMLRLNWVVLRSVTAAETRFTHVIAPRLGIVDQDV